MSMISEQVKELKKVSEWYKESNNYLQKVLLQAADTIESLSAKLAKESMERSSKYYEEEKKLIEEMAEEIENCYGRETELTERAREYINNQSKGGLL